VSSGGSERSFVQRRSACMGGDMVKLIKEVGCSLNLRSHESYTFFDGSTCASLKHQRQESRSILEQSVLWYQAKAKKNTCQQNLTALVRLRLRSTRYW
jgi:hypothetical protein